ncbi:cysteine hydrolase family protein [Megalodesulfovibrio paquesii]
MPDAPRSPSTLLAMAGLSPIPAGIAHSAVVLVDYQQEYVDGALPLVGIAAALEQARALLLRARQLGAPIIHVVHAGAPGGPFDRSAPRGQIVACLQPAPGELVLEKKLPNSFAGTPLAAALAETGRKAWILAGCMTHMCLSATARAALDLALPCGLPAIPAAACVTRDLPDPLSDPLPAAQGGPGIIPAAVLHRAALAALADRFARVVPDVQALPDA